MQSGEKIPACQASRLYHIGPSLRSGEQAVRFVIVDETFTCRIPMEFSPELHYSVVQQAGGALPVADFYRGDGLLPGFDAVQPVSMVVAAFVEVYFVGTNFRGNDL